MPVVAATYGEAANGSIMAVSQCGSTIASSSVKTMTSPRAASTPRLRAPRQARDGTQDDAQARIVDARERRAGQPVGGALSTTMSSKSG